MIFFRPWDEYGQIKDWPRNGNTAIAVIIFINTWQFVGVHL